MKFYYLPQRLRSPGRLPVEGKSAGFGRKAETKLCSAKLESLRLRTDVKPNFRSEVCPRTVWKALHVTRVLFDTQRFVHGRMEGSIPLHYGVDFEPVRPRI